MEAGANVCAYVVVEGGAGAVGAVELFFESFAWCAVFEENKQI